MKTSGRCSSSANKNAAARKLWWGDPDRTLAWVLDHIAAGNHPRLRMPMRHWLPRRMDGPASSSSRSSSSTPRTLRAGGIVVGSPPTAPSTRLLRPKKESGSSEASNARVKEEAGVPSSFTHVKKEPGVTPISLARAKKEPGAPAPPSSKKARRLVEDAAL
jgi:hypothetical protein